MHIIFVEDLLVFTKANRKSLLAVKKILKRFEAFFGLTTNPAKSEIYFSSLVQNRDELSKILNYPLKTLPIKYIGVLLVGRELRSMDCIELLDKMWGYFMYWKIHCLSYYGRILLV